MDKYWPYGLPEPEQKVSLLNEPNERFRDTGTATLLHRWPSIPLRAMLGDCLAQTQQLLARLEAGLVLPKGVCREEYEAVLRALYCRTADQIRVLQDALALEGLE
jgi:hypothetical protein